MPFNCGVWLLSSGGFRLFPGSFTVDTWRLYYTALIKIMADAIPYFDHKHMVSSLFSVIFCTVFICLDGRKCFI